MVSCDSKMPKKHQTVKVVKIPLKQSTADYPQVFPRMPRLYLELIENKAKIKQDLINKEYIPVNTYSSEGPPNLDFRDTPPKYKDTEHYEKRSRDNDTDSSDDDFDYQKTKSNKTSNNFESRLDKLLSDDSDSDSDSTLSPSNVSVASSISDLSIQENKETKGKDDGYSSADSEELSVRLKELLNDDSNSESSFDKFEQTLDKKSRQRSSVSNKYSRHRDSHGHTINNFGPENSAPTLAELQERGGYVPKKELRDINHTTMSEQQEEDVKRELLFKFDLLRKSYPSSTIPDYNIHTDLNTMQKSYDDTVRRLSLDSTVESYKTYLVYGFMGCEFVFGNFLGFDMQGFTQQQIVSMNSYEKLLIELGEKSYVPSGSKWPVELRLFMMIIMNAAFFVVSKMIMKKTGSNLMGMINNMQTSTQASTSHPTQKRKMRGPNIDLNNIPDLDEPSLNTQGVI